MRIDLIKNPQLRRALKISGLDDLKLTNLTNNYQIFNIHTPEYEQKVLTAVMDYCSRLKASKEKQKKFIFYGIQNDYFLLKTAQQQDQLIEKLQYEYQKMKVKHDPAESFRAGFPLMETTQAEDLIKLTTIVEFCTANDLDLIPCFEHIWENHPYFPLETSHDQVREYITYFTENAITYRQLEINTTRIYSDLGYRRVSHHLCAAKFR